MTKTKTARKINPKAKKYKSLLALQKEVNKMMKESAQRLGKEHKAYKQAQAKKRQFYKKRGLRVPALFSMKNLKTSDVEAYRALLESIKNSTYINKENYEKYHKSKVQGLIDKGLAKDEKEALKVYDILNEYKDLIEQLGVKPSEVAILIDEMINEYNMTEDEFVKIFVNVATYLGENGDVNNFFDLTEKYAEVQNTIQLLEEDGVKMSDILNYLSFMNVSSFEKMAEGYLTQGNKEGVEKMSFVDFAESWLNG